MDVLLALALLLGFLGLVWRIGRPTDTSLRSTPPPPKHPIPIPRAAASQRDDRFDVATSHRTTPGRTLSGKVYVTDGDTITVQKTKVRLFGIDAPELNHPYGRKAKWALHALCKDQVIRAEISAEDDYGRTVARCFLPDGRDLSAEMVKQGLALDWPKFSGGKYSDLEVPDARRKLFLADARQKGRMHIWETYEARRKSQARGA